MFDIGFWEITLIFVVGLLILGPERMPQVARTAGLFLGRARAAMRKLQREVQRELMVAETRAAVDAARKAFDEPVVPDVQPRAASGESVEPRIDPRAASEQSVEPRITPQPRSASDEAVAPDIETPKRNDDQRS